ncbi:MAG: hypothetical protein GX590_06385 [Lentisphaerae bacterium]|nr:hypothetical protein [Lentisphaerota bacterium]
MNSTKIAVVGLMAGLLGAAGLHAGEAGVPAEKQATKAKVEKAAPFAGADANADGMLSLDEFKQMDAKRQEMRKAKMGDKYDPAKAAKMPSADARFKKLDANADGLLTKEEMTAARARPDKKARQPKVKDGAAVAE